MRKALRVPPDRLVRAGAHLVELGQVAIEQHLLAPDQENAAFNGGNRGWLSESGISAGNSVAGGGSEDKAKLDEKKHSHEVFSRP